ncbi:hypothetical protein QBZ16_003239 [Prototheca wickerhamii]|uniref:Carboxypeptidase Taq n=1 Tax=Prototheca wickerhamii TaxID=3111 RepID=A0AAD9IJP0_PROWI|nr:hypothetical protein QBZ16_003239 [Prototheca wickerhamii]
MATKAAPKEFDELVAKLKEVQALSGISGLLGWDEMVMMPPAAAASRGAQKAALAGVLHERTTDPEIGRLLEKLDGVAFEDPYRTAAVREAKHDYQKATRITSSLAKREAEHETEAYQAWIKAREAKSFEPFSRALGKWVRLRRERASLIDPGQNAYDVLLDEFQPGLTSARLDEIFGQVKAGLVPLLARVRAHGAAPDDAWLNGGPFDREAQAALCRQLSLDLGFDLDSGRLDVSVHPFTGGAHPTDVRMTTRFKDDQLLDGIAGTIHETGHALYEQGRNLDYDGLPVNEAAGMAVHESQSLLWERMVGQGRPFAQFLLPKLQEAFPQLDKTKTAEDLYSGKNVVLTKSLIRVEADELTYPLHIILRYELETALLRGDIEVVDLPALWNKKMEEYLGVEPKDDVEGILQDVHWSYGSFGYFPTYSLGAMMAAQIFQTAQQELPDLDASLAKGDFAPLKTWLNGKIHKIGRLHPTMDDLLVEVTGEPLNPQIFLDYLTKKYTELYQL